LIWLRACPAIAVGIKLALWASLIALLGSSVAIHEAHCDDAVTADVSPNTVVQLLSNKTHNVSKDVLNDRLIEFPVKRISFAILSSQGSSDIANDFGAFIQEARKHKVGVELYPVDAPKFADIVILYGSRPAALFDKYALTINDITAIQGQHSDMTDEDRGKLSQLLQTTAERCLSFATAADSVRIQKAFIFVSNDNSAVAAQHCLSRMTLSVLGLSSEVVGGDTIMSPDVKQPMPTKTDFVALRLLYEDPTPGRPIGELLRRHPEIRFSPKAISDASAAGKSAGNRDTVKLLLSQNVHDLVPSLENDRLIRWPAGVVAYFLIGSKPTPLVEQTFADVEKILRTNHAVISLQKSGDIKEADIVLIYESSPDKGFANPNYTMADILGVPGAGQTEDELSPLRQALEAEGHECFAMRQYSGSRLAKEIVFISDRRNEFLTEQCAYSMALGSLGLSNIGILGESVLPPNSRISRPSESDKLALRILYQSETQGAETVGEAMKAADVDAILK